MRTGYEMGLDRAGCCSPGVARQFAPLLKVISSFGAFTVFHLQLYRSPHGRGGQDKRQEGEGSKNGFC